MAVSLATIIKSTPIGLKILGTAQEKPGLSRRVVRPGDDILIDGFPRSANTFATDAFKQAQGKALKIANHMHSPAQFILAKRYAVPALLVIRQPEQAVSSLVVYGDAGPLDGLERYIRFHEIVSGASDGYLVAPFEEVISDFGKTIERLNLKFGTRFVPYVHSSEGDQLLMDANRRKVGSRNASKQAGRADITRESALAAFQQPDAANLMKHANSIYQDLIAAHGRTR